MSDFDCLYCRGCNVPIAERDAMHAGREKLGYQGCLGFDEPPPPGQAVWCEECFYLRGQHPTFPGFDLDLYHVYLNGPVEKGETPFGDQG